MYEEKCNHTVALDICSLLYDGGAGVIDTELDKDNLLSPKLESCVFWKSKHFKLNYSHIISEILKDWITI